VLVRRVLQIQAVAVAVAIMDPAAVLVALAL